MTVLASKYIPKIIHNEVNMNVCEMNEAQNQFVHYITICLYPDFYFFFVCPVLLEGQKYY